MAHGTWKQRLKDHIFGFIDRSESLFKPIRAILFRILRVDEVVLRGLRPDARFELPTGETAQRVLDRLTLLETRLLWATHGLPQHMGTLRSQALALQSRPVQLLGALRTLSRAECVAAASYRQTLLEWVDGLPPATGELPSASSRPAIVPIVASAHLLNDPADIAKDEDDAPFSVDVLNPIRDTLARKALRPVWLVPANDLYAPAVSERLRGSSLHSLQDDVLTGDLLTLLAAWEPEDIHALWFADVLDWNHPLIALLLMEEFLRLAGPTGTGATPQSEQQSLPKPVAGVLYGDNPSRLMARRPGVPVKPESLKAFWGTTIVSKIRFQEMGDLTLVSCGHPREVP